MASLGSLKWGLGALDAFDRGPKPVPGRPRGGWRPEAVAALWRRGCLARAGRDLKDSDCYVGYVLSYKCLVYFLYVTYFRYSMFCIIY